MLESSSIAPASSITISFPLVSRIPANVGVISLDTFPMFESTTSVPLIYNILEVFSVAAKTTPVCPETKTVTVKAPEVLFLIT